MEFRQSNKLRDVCYEIRGPAVEQANLLEEAGHSVLRLNTGNPALFDFEAPEEIVQDMIRMLPQAHGYTDSRGVLPARRAVAGRYQARGLGVDVDHVFIGNGVSELIVMAMQGLLDDGDEVLVPSPGLSAVDGRGVAVRRPAVHYRCDEQSDWMPDLADVGGRSPTATKAMRHQPEQPDGRGVREEMLARPTDLARRPTACG